jgi:hypothetical protein
MMNFCTLFDYNYASKGIAMYLSLEQHTDDFVLYVMGMDRKCQERLNALGFKHMIVECIDDVDSPDLTKAKGNRSRAEFCWTCGAFFTDYFLHKYKLPDITYLDSDLMFFSSPRVVFEELEIANASVGIVPHFKKYNLFGIYNVEYVYFRNDEDGRSCLRWWRDECLKWCYNKLEEGKYGDQKYLDYFTDKFNNVHAIVNRGVGIASWNMNSYNYKDGQVVYKGQKWPFVFFHYSGFRVDVIEKELIIRYTIYLKDSIRRTFVAPYAELMKEVFGKYLNIPITNINFKPLDMKKYFVRAIWHHLDRFLPIEWIIVQFMKLKYKEKHSPYSER